MDVAWLIVVLVIAALSCLGLGGLVLSRDKGNAANRAFALVCFNLALWTGGVAGIVQSGTESEARVWLALTFMVSAFLPASFYYFIGVFPTGRFQGQRWFLAALYAAGALLAAGALTPWHVTSVNMDEGPLPVAAYGHVFLAFAVVTVVTVVVSFANLVRKRRSAEGVQRRQIEHVMFGIYLSVFFIVFTNVLGPLLEISYLEAYGPIFVVFMMTVFAYAMVRYQLLDIWVIVSRTTLYTVLTGFVLLTFLGAVAITHSLVHDENAPTGVVSTIIAAVVIAIVLQPAKERLQLFLDRHIVNRRYDAQALLTRLSRTCSQMVRLNELLPAAAGDIQQTVGIEHVRVFLVDEKDPGVLILEHASDSSEPGARSREFIPLLNHLRVRPEPLVLDQLLHVPRPQAQVVLQDQLTVLNAEVCVPLATASGLVGVVALGPKTSRDIYTAGDLSIFSAVSGPLATAIENARLYRRLEEANMHRARILSNMRGGVIAVDINGVITTVNRGAVETVGPVSRGEPLQTLPEEVANVLRQTLEERQAIRDYEAIIAGPDNQESYVVISSSTLVSTDNSVTGAMVMIYDLTQVKRLEQNVQRADKLSSLGVLAAGMAHEIKNPLVSIKTLSQLFEDRYMDESFRSTFCDLVPREVDRIDSIVSRLLDFARPRPASFAAHNVCGVLKRVLSLVENQTRTGRIEVRETFPPSGLPVAGDEQQLHQAFLNIVLNAIDAMKDADIRTLRVEASRSKMRSGGGARPHREIECARIVIGDTGCGIPPGRLDAIFTPFYTTKEYGSGLGLPVVHGILTEHNGEIHVTSRVNEGATFTIRLPLVTNVAPVETR